MNRQFTRLEAVVFGGTSILISFARFAAIRVSFGDSSFRGYALWLTAIMAVPELLTLLVDSNRISDSGVPRRALLGSLMVGLAAFAALWFSGGKPPILLLVYTAIDALLFIEVAYRRREVNWFLHAMRVVALILIWQKLLGALVIAAAASCTIALFADSTAKRAPEPWSRKGFMQLRKVFVISSLARTGDWAFTYATQLVLTGKIYFFFYMLIKVTSAASAATYAMVRSSTTFDIPDLYRRARIILSDWRVEVAWFSAAAIAITFGAGPWIFLLGSMVASFTSQLALFGVSNGTSRLLIFTFVSLAASGFCIVLAPWPPVFWGIMLLGNALAVYFVVSRDLLHGRRLLNWRQAPTRADPAAPP